MREGEAPPSLIYRSKLMPYHWLARTQEILKELEEQGIIVKTTVPSDFCSPSFCVPKPNNPSEPRLVVNFTKINQKIKRFQQKRDKSGNVLDFCDEEPFNPDYVEVDRVLDSSSHTDEATNVRH